MLTSPPHAETDQGEDDDDDGGHGGAHRHGHHLAVYLALLPVEVARALADPAPGLDAAHPLVGAELGRAGLAVTAGHLGVGGELVPVAPEALAREAAEQIDADTEVPAVVVLWLRALVEVLHPGDGVKGTGDIEVTTSNVVRPGLDNFNELVLDVTLDNLRSCIGVLFHLESRVNGHCSIE